MNEQQNVSILLFKRKAECYTKYICNTALTLFFPTFTKGFQGLSLLLNEKFTTSRDILHILSLPLGEHDASDHDPLFKHVT